MNTRFRALVRLMIVALLVPGLSACSREEEKEPVDGLEITLPDPPTGPPGTFLKVGDMVQARKDFRVWQQGDGNVLVLGGKDDAGAVLDSAERYDYHEGEFRGMPYPMSDARVFFAVSPLGDGTLLICGGTDGASTLDSVDIFDPATLEFSAATPLVTPRSGHAALALLNNNVFLCGGRDGSGTVLATGEVYDRTTGDWIATDNAMSVPRADHSVTLLTNGKVLIAGGVDAAGNTLSSAEIFDPGAGTGQSGTFAATGSMPAARAGHRARMVNGGAYVDQVVLAGGYKGTVSSPASLSTACAFDPKANGNVGAFTAILQGMAGARRDFTFTLLSGGQTMLAAGGNDLNVPEVFDPYALGSSSGMALDADFLRTQDDAGTPTSMTAVTHGRTGHGAAWMPNGTILLCGGEDGAAVTATAEIYNP